MGDNIFVLVSLAFPRSVQIQRARGQMLGWRFWAELCAGVVGGEFCQKYPKIGRRRLPAVAQTR
jgi:hypothetical protein